MLANETLANVTTVPIDLPLEMTNGASIFCLRKFLVL